MITRGWAGYTARTRNDGITRGKTLERALCFVSTWSTHAKYYWLLEPRGETTVLCGKKRFAAIVTVHWRQPGTFCSWCIHICTQTRYTKYRNAFWTVCCVRSQWNLKRLDGTVSQGWYSLSGAWFCLILLRFWMCSKYWKRWKPWLVYKSQNCCQKFLVILYTHKLFSANFSYLDFRDFLSFFSKWKINWGPGQIVQQLKLVAFSEDLSSHHPCGGLQLSNVSSRRSDAHFWHPHGPDM